MYCDAFCPASHAIVATELSLIQCLGLFYTKGKRQLAIEFTNFGEK